MGIGQSGVGFYSSATNEQAGDAKGANQAEGKEETHGAG
jgi:hypothetical protein